MGKNGKGKNRNYLDTENHIYIEDPETHQRQRKEIMQGEFCVYCGKWIMSPEAPFYANINTRVAPCCCSECRDKTEKYVEQDKTYKIVLYAIMFIAALGVFTGALFSQNPRVVYPCVCGVGLAMLFFPYPITSFETFLRSPIRKVTAMTRIIGAVILAAGLFFFVNLAL